MSTNGWQALLRQQLPEAKRIMLFDADGLYEEMLPLLEQEGWTVLRHVTYMDTLLRWQRLQQGGQAVVVYVRSLGSGLPHSVASACASKTVVWEGVFPGLNREAMQELERDHWPEAWSCCGAEAMRTRDETIIAVSDAIFGLNIREMNSVLGFLRGAIRMHYRGLLLPKNYGKQLAAEISEPAVHALGPLADLLTSRDVFLRFIQNAWQDYVSALAGGADLAIQLPFAEHDLRAYMDNLFNEGFLEPQPWTARETPPLWMRAGLQLGQTLDSERLEANIRALLEKCPEADASFDQWSSFAGQMGRLEVLYHKSPPHEAATHLYRDLKEKTGRSFSDWMLSQYALQQSKAITDSPYLGCHVPQVMHRRMVDGQAKVALVVMDAMAWDAWISLRSGVSEAAIGTELVERSVLAQIPSITSISRQAIFAGKPASAFADTMFSTDAEGRLWRQYWLERAVPDAAYCGVLKGQDEAELDAVKEHLDKRAVGLVVSFVDETAHGSTQGLAGIHASLSLWMQKGWLRALVDMLLGSGFDIFLTADHGYTVAKGMGSPSQGVLVTKRGQRARLYRDEAFMQAAKAQFSDSIVWPAIGLPAGYHCLLAPTGMAFDTFGNETIVHGGISLEEAMVPFVHIRRNGNEPTNRI